MSTTLLSRLSSWWTRHCGGNHCATGSGTLPYPPRSAALGCPDTSEGPAPTISFDAFYDQRAANRRAMDQSTNPPVTIK